MRMRPLIAVAGPAGVPRYRAARRVAGILELPHLDSDVLWRCAALLWAREESTGLTLATSARRLMEPGIVVFHHDGAATRTSIEGRDVTAELAELGVDGRFVASSGDPAAQAAVRDWMERLIAAGGIVIEDCVRDPFVHDAEFRFALPDVGFDEAVVAFCGSVRAAMARQAMADAEVHTRKYGSLILLAGRTKGRMATRKSDFKLLVIRPGDETSHHRHFAAESIFHVAEGSVGYELDGVGARLDPGDTLIVPAGARHRLWNDGASAARIYEMESPPHDPADKLLVDAPRTFRRRRTLGSAWTPSRAPLVKVCGVDNLDGAIVCHDLGAAAVGFHAVGRDRVDRVRHAERWLSAVPDELSVFLLTDATDPEELLYLAEHAWCDAVQLQKVRDVGLLPACRDALGAADVRLVVSLGLDELGEGAVGHARHAAQYCDAILIDTSFRGGTGRVADWALARRVVESVPDRPAWLAGGLGPDNVGAAVRAVRPFGLDVESGVERRFPSRGGGRSVSIRDREAIARFLAATRSVTP